MRAVPPPYPPNAPGLRIARWQGIRYEIGFWATAFATAVQTRLGIAISVYVLVAIVRKRLKIERDLYPLLQVLSVHRFEKALLAQVFAGPGYTLDDTHVRNQLRLFDF